MVQSGDTGLKSGFTSEPGFTSGLGLTSGLGFAAELGEWRAAGGTLPESIAAGVREAVMDGRIPVGSTLPSERVLAAELGTSRATVVAALALLRADGWVRTLRGSGTAVRLPPHLTERTAPWSVDHNRQDALDLTLGRIAAPHQPYLTAMLRAAERCQTFLLDDGSPAPGLPRLREILAERYTAEGLATRPEQILVTTGATSSLLLLTDHLHDRRRPVAVENPGFHSLIVHLRHRRARLAAVPVTAAGWDLDRLFQLVRQSRANLAYLTPDFHNPTGTLMADEARRRTAELAAAHDVTIIADETMRALDLRRPAEPIKHLAGTNIVHVGSTSKMIWGGLRIGWIRGPAELVRTLLLNPLQERFVPPPLEQLIACELLGDSAELLDERRARLRAQRDHLAERLSDGPWSFTLPPGGFTLWLRLNHLTAAELAARARARGLVVSPGTHFSVDRTLTRYLRLPFTATPDLLTRAVDLLRAAETLAP